MTDAKYEEWARDGDVLAQIGRAMLGQETRVSVRLPRVLADEALASWQRDDSDAPLPAETPEQRRIRYRAAALGLIGLSVEEGAVADGDEVVVSVDAWHIGEAFRAADEDGLLGEATPPRAARLTDDEYLRKVEVLAHDVCEEAAVEGWLSYEPDPPAASPIQRAVNELARNLRHVHYDGDGCLDDDPAEDVPPQ